MQCYTELTLPTAVTHSLSLPFLSASANNLVVVKTSLLQIFSLKTIITHANSPATHNNVQSTTHVDQERGPLPRSSLSDPATARGDRLHTTKLVLVAQYEIPGIITSIARVKILRSKSGGEALLVALKDAKLSLVEWDPERHCISTISIHYYEREDILSSPWEPDLGQCVNYLSVDPSSRCAVLKFGTRHLAILPFHQVGDDLVMDDYDPDIDGERPEKKQSIPKNTTDGATIEKTLYAASFVLSLLALDPSLSHPIHLSFLYEYREPTFGVLYSQIASSSSLLHERRDNISYSVYTLDLEQRASTTLLSVNNLPYDLFTVVPLSRLIGGALLIGGNEIIHIDQSGKSIGVAVNDFAKQSTPFPLVDQSDMNMRLENCLMKELGSDNTELLIVLSTGELAILSFKIDGRSVSGLAIRRVHAENGGGALLAGPSCASIVGRGRLFLGSEDSDSLILGWSRKYDRTKRQRSRVEIDADEADDMELDEDDLDDDDDEDDLYAENKPNEKSGEQFSPSLVTDGIDYSFRVHDLMMNAAPMTDVALRTQSNESKNTASTKLSNSIDGFLTTTGRGRAGGLTIFEQDIRPDLAKQFDLDNTQAVWSVNVRGTQEDGSANASGEELDSYILASVGDATGADKSTVYRIQGGDLEEIHNAEFDTDAGDTVDVATINGGTMIAQVSQNQVRTHDGDFNLVQIFEITEPDSDLEQPKVVSASFADPFILLIRDDASILLLTIDERGEIEEATRGVEGQWLSGSLYEDSNDVLRLEFPEDSEDEAGNVLMFLLSATGGLKIYRMPNIHKAVYVADGLSFLPPFLAADFGIRRSSARESLTEILVTELGDSTQKSPYLILRSSSDDLVIYQPYQAPVTGSRDTALQFLKIPNPHIPKAQTEESNDDGQGSRRQPLRSLHDIGGYSAVFKPGASPNFIIKSASSLPQVFGFAEDYVKSITPLNTLSCRKGFVYINREGKSKTAQLPFQGQYDTGWVTRQIRLGEEVHALSYHEKKHAYVLGTSTLVDFRLPEDDFHHTWNEEETRFLPQVEQGSVKLLDGQSLKIIDKHGLEPFEVVTAIKTLSLEISEITHERQDLVAVGTALIRGEDLPSAGHIYIFAIIDVVPEPDHPETGRAFKLISKEEVKGAVTALSTIGTQGFLLVAQGQKCMVRGLKEDGTLLPVAFMDMQCYISAAKELPETGMCLMADAVKGVWFTGYMEEPYGLRLFSKSPHHIEAIAADFLPDGKQLYIVVADGNCNLHILQFDPEHPKSMSGQRLLHHTTFHTGHFPSTTTLLPPTNHPSPLLITTQTGSLALLTPLSPSAHRTLSSLQSHLQNTLPHHLGLNPRSHRLPTEGVKGEGVGRGGVVDGNVLRRWMEGGSWRRWGGDAGGEGEEGVRGVLRGALGRGLFC